MGCFVRGGKNGMGCFVRGDKNCMGCFVRGGKLMRDVLSGVAKNGMGCFVPGCFVLHSLLWYSLFQFTKNMDSDQTGSLITVQTDCLHAKSSLEYIRIYAADVISR